MLNIEIDENKLKEDTKDYFNIFYMNLIFSNIDTIEMEFKEAKLHENGKLLLASEQTKSHVESFDVLSSRGKRNNFITKTKVETVYIDYDYLMELGNNDTFELKYVGSEQDGTNIRYELSWANKNKFTKVNIPKRDRIY